MLSIQLFYTPAAIRPCGHPYNVFRYDRLAKSTGRTKTFYMTEALAAEIDRLEYEYGLLKKVEDYRAGRLETVTLDELKESLGLAD